MLMAAIDPANAAAYNANAKAFFTLYLDQIIRYTPGGLAFPYHWGAFRPTTQVPYSTSHRALSHVHSTLSPNMRLKPSTLSPGLATHTPWLPTRICGSLSLKPYAQDSVSTVSRVCRPPSWLWWLPSSFAPLAEEMQLMAPNYSTGRSTR